MRELRVSNKLKDVPSIADNEQAVENTTAALTATEADQRERQQLITELGLSSIVPNAATMRGFAKGTFGDIDLTGSVKILNEKIRTVQGGNLSGLEATLMAQAMALDAIFNDLAQRAVARIDDCPTTTETYLRLGLKAQAQCRATLQTLAEIKNPQLVAFVKQANIAHGPQQVNNGLHSDQPARARAPAGNSTNASNELLGADHGAWLDTGTTGAAAGVNTRLEAMDVFQWPEERPRQGLVRGQCPTPRLAKPPRPG
jgi:hypothetical protein